MAKDNRDAPPGTKPGDPSPKIRWDDANLNRSSANVGNVSSTREEVVLVFRTPQAWERAPNEMEVRRTDRIILSPFAAKRLAGVLATVAREYESRFGALSIDSRREGEFIER